MHGFGSLAYLGLLLPSPSIDPEMCQRGRAQELGHALEALSLYNLENQLETVLHRVKAARIRFDGMGEVVEHSCQAQAQPHNAHLPDHHQQHQSHVSFGDRLSTACGAAPCIGLFLRILYAAFELLIPKLRVKDTGPCWGREVFLFCWSRAVFKQFEQPLRKGRSEKYPEAHWAQEVTGRCCSTDTREFSLFCFSGFCHGTHVVRTLSGYGHLHVLSLAVSRVAAQQPTPCLGLSCRYYQRLRSVHMYICFPVGSPNSQQESLG